ncbi:MAG: DNA repair and recombination protein RadA, partial [Methanomassiliicoccales archaeon]
VGGFESGDVILERRKGMRRLTSSSKAFDEMLGGGLETQAITEFFGEFGSGKTQMCFQLAVNATMSTDKGGLAGEVVVIDTENTFRPERIAQIASALDLDPIETLQRIHVARAYNSSHQMLLVDKATDIAKEKNIRLMIVDSLTAHFRAEFVGRGTLAERQGLLNKHMHDLLRFADVNNSAIAVTNQVAAKPDAFFGDPTRPVGGHIVGHASTYRLYMRKSKGGKRIARLIDSPNLPEAEVVITVSEEGIRD